MSKYSAVLLAALLSLSAWSEIANPAHRRHHTAVPTPQLRATVLFQDPLLGTVKMRPVYTPTAKFGTSEKTPLVATNGPQPYGRSQPAAGTQRPGVSVDQTKTVRPGSWR